MNDTSLLHERSGSAVAERLSRSAAATEGAEMATADVVGWLAARRQAGDARIRRIPFAELEGWSFAPGTGNLGHRSGRFFTIEGLHVVTSDREWQQPIIRQPEIGILGILAREIEGILHFLMQAKMEPGNPNLVQLSPTVQATRSNYTAAHGGSPVRYLEHFLEPDRGRVLTDVLQSEHGAWFYRKRNRNMIVEVDGHVPSHENFRWLTLGQIGVLLRQDNVVNMDARTVLASVPMRYPDRSALSSDGEVMSWFTGERARQDVQVRRKPLQELEDWTRDEHCVGRADGRFFRVLALAVEVAGREVARWTQPILEPVGPGVVGFAYRLFGGVPHLLVHARVEGGFLDTAELAPTVQYMPANYGHLPPQEQPRFLDLLSRAAGDRIRYSAVHSEEGGRFLNAESRYMIVETDESTTPAEAPAGYQWLTPGQLAGLAGHSRYVNVQARTLLAVLNAGAVDLGRRGHWADPCPPRSNGLESRAEWRS